MEKLELGYLGQFFGAGAKAGTNIAGFIAGLAVLLLALTLFVEIQEVSTIRSGLISIITSAMGYIFGASRKA